MKTYVRFEEFGESASGLTKIWMVKNSNSNFTVGRVKWQATWRKYIFEPAPNCIFDTNCLSEIVQFVESRMEAHNAR